MQYETHADTHAATIDAPRPRERRGEATAAEPTRERLARKGQALKQDVRELGALAKDAASESLQEVSSRAQESLEAQRERLAQLEHRTADKVRANPWKSLAAVAGAGALIGAFLRR